MTNQQFSDEFDTLLNTQSVIKQFGLTQGIELDEYEKSVFLSNAQEELVRQTYQGLNVKREGFDETELSRRYLDRLIKQQAVTSTANINASEKINGTSTFFILPTDLMVITLEQLEVTSIEECYNNQILNVIPIRQDEYLVSKSNPFKLPSMKGRSKKAWRLDYGNNENRVVEIIAPSEVTPSKYIVRYLRKPKPIILTTLADGLNIDNETTEQSSELDSIFHRQILELAVLKALQSKSLISNQNK